MIYHNIEIKAKQRIYKVISTWHWFYRFDVFCVTTWQISSSRRIKSSTCRWRWGRFCDSGTVLWHL